MKLNYRYQDEFPIDSKIEDRRRKYVGDVYLNQAACTLCNDIIISRNKHDYNVCKCGNLSVDGGSWYLKRSVKGADSWKEMSIYYNDKKEKV